MAPQRPALRTDIHSSVVLPDDHVTKGLFSCFVSDDDWTTLVKLLGVAAAWTWLSTGD
jgi:hypothetical protein